MRVVAEFIHTHALGIYARAPQVIRVDPTAMTYAAVFNLCTLYDLQVCCMS